MLKIEVICIGDELLNGQTVNTNAAWLGSYFSRLGWKVSKSTCIRDDRNAIFDALSSIEKGVELVVLTGGLGPTTDDVTKQALAEFFSSHLVLNQVILNKIEQYFSDRNLPILEVNRRQAFLPDRALVLNNSRGTASGMLFKMDGVNVVALPGVPYEMKGIVADELVPYLLKSCEVENELSITIQTIGLGETYIAESLQELIDELEEKGLYLSYLPSPGKVRIRLNAKDKNAQLLLDEFAGKIVEKLGSIVYGFGDDSLEDVVGKMLLSLKATVACAESCTGGTIGHKLTSVSGSSAYFKGGIIAYHNEIKNTYLGVPFEDIESFGAVSSKVVEQMARAVRINFETDYGIATSGIAGPEGGSIEKPVGTIWIAIATPNEVYSEQLSLGNSRSRNIEITSLYALNKLRKVILSELQE